VTALRSCPRDRCYVCGGEGRPLYTGIPDRLFGTAGEWTLVQCVKAECGLMWLNPMPLEEDIAKAYATYYTHEDSAQQHSILLAQLYSAARRGYLSRRYGYHTESRNMAASLAGWLLYLHPGRRAVVDFSVMWLAREGEGRLLDVGCGSGAFLANMQSLGWRVEGVDFDAAAAANAARKGLNVHVGSLADQRFTDDAFDAITMSHFIEHVHEPRALLEECLRILRPGGRVVIVTPNSRSYGHSRYGRNWMHLDPPRHLHLFDARNLTVLAETAGFQVDRVVTSLRDAYGMFIGSRAISRNGTYAMSGVASRSVRAWARAMELAEWLLLKRRPKVGEEIVLIAHKRSRVINMQR
jgi:2-polyprenyl-3-methyl-5-hydroxy-6-metoxy-1,4-benzoquinol methylase